MKTKNFFQKILAAILGILVITSIANLIEAFLLTIYLFIFRPESISHLFWIISLLYNLTILILGIYLGLNSYKTKNIWYKIFRPTKIKAIISAVLSLILVFVIVLGGQGNIGYTSSSLTPLSRTIFVPLLFFTYFVYFYPFSALYNSISKTKKNKQYKKSKTILFISLILLNPIFVVLSSQLVTLYSYVINNEPCGVRIVSFNENSPAKDAGIQAGEIIIQMNDFSINTLDDLNEFMDSYNQDEEIIIHTETGSYNVLPYYQDEKYWIGINIDQEICKRTLIK